MDIVSPRMFWERSKSQAKKKPSLNP
jgi:hypothetical protein